ncbi:hypothetical protein EVAR_32043_1 [Eumeta japonica]|uniref:Uncharacterized protein n=1 Tax=Eumeta variegata TaxID=151549 RepID=A0A4C1WQV9_EUMVA|nr:hypothetical protein EVAR_32043_1 [Eumeta japonica]
MELPLSGRNATAEAITSRLYSWRIRNEEYHKRTKVTGTIYRIGKLKRQWTGHIALELITVGQERFWNGDDADIAVCSFGRPLTTCTDELAKVVYQLRWLQEARDGTRRGNSGCRPQSSSELSIETKGLLSLKENGEAIQSINKNWVLDLQRCKLIIHDHLFLRKRCSRWVLRKLIDEQQEPQGKLVPICDRRFDEGKKKSL